MGLDIKLRLAGTVIRSPQIRPKLFRAIERGALEAENAVKLSGKVPNNTGALKTSISRFVFLDRLRAEVGSPLKYDVVMEQGRRRGKRMPPKAPIRQWILQKGIYEDAIKDEAKRTKEINRTRRRLATKLGIKKPRQLAEPTQKLKARQIGSLAGKVRAGRKEKRRDVKRALNLLNSLTFVIRRAIGRDGIPGHGYYAAIVPKMKARMKTIMLEEMRRK